jgi:hypothetical protein
MTDYGQLFERLAHLHTIVPVFARELTRARRQATSLRAENGRLLDQVRRLQRQRASGGAARFNQRVSTPTGATEQPETTVELTGEQLACIEALAEDCIIIGADDGRPLVRLVDGEVALLEGDGSLVPAARGIQAATPYMEVERA